MKAIRIYEPGGPEKLIYEEVETPSVKEGWSLVRVLGFGINHSEIFTRKGQSPSVKFPRILGIECVGVIEDTTDEKRLPKGQKVISIMGEMGRAFDGGYAEFTLLPNEQIHPVETSLPIEQWAALPETYFTAYGSMKRLRLTEKMSDRRSLPTVLVRGATSGVGIAFLRLLKASYPEIRVTGTSRRAEKKARLLSEGFDEVVIDRDNELLTDLSYDRILDL
ncbi:MAG: alcohol dehydrogenase catalytic domain-containing protein, partial [Lachnospiraceae bacterium]|nr:alcohol dehydrogenase catalytic domain-containing protein [Lachnospiraceae bacterium]